VFPVRDVNPTRTTPYVTYGLIAANLVVWTVAWGLGPPGIEAFVRVLGAVPRALVTLGDPIVLLTPLTSMFMHGSWLHVLGNVWFLHVFGDNVEDHLGHVRFAFFYVLAGLCAIVAHVVLAWSSTIPLVGASGAIAGVLGAYMLRYPRAPILAWFVIGLVELPAFVFLFVWFGYQLLMTVGSLGPAMEHGGVAFAAHVGGFVAGIALDRLLGPSSHEMAKRQAERLERLAEVRTRRLPRRRWLDVE
jgi:membrane associated rhomboid family serine protease